MSRSETGLLENEFVRVQVDPGTGGLASVYDKTRRREYVRTGPQPILFRLIVPDGQRACNHQDSVPAECRVTGQAMRIRYRFDALEAEAVLSLDGPSVVAALRIVNTGALNIEEIQFPWVTGLSPLSDADIVMPSFHRRRIADPLGEGLGGDHRHAEEYGKKVVTRYPERLTTAWCDYGNADGGITIEARHTDFSIVDFFIRKGIDKTAEPIRRSLDIATVFPHRIKPGQTWDSPPVRISVHAGDWHVAADAHREWVETWITKPDRSRKFAESIGWHYFFLKHQDGHARFAYADLPELARAALAAGCPYLLLFGWQSGGHDNNYMYEYVSSEAWGGVPALREAIGKARALGVEVIPFYNGTLANVGLPQHREFGHRWEAYTREGQPYYAGDWAGFNFDAPTTNRSRIHHEVCLCEEYRPYLLATARRIITEYGFRNLQLDQVAIKMAPCYNPDHHHSRPDRAYVEGWKAILPEVRARVRVDNPEGIILGECTNEFDAHWCDGAWTWDFLAFPEPVLYSVPWLLTSTAVDALEYAEVNKAFAYKISLDMRIGGGDEAVAQYPAFAAHIKGLADLRRRVAPYYVYADFRDRENLRGFTGEGVMATVFRNREAHKVGIVLAEIQGMASKVTFSVDWRPRNGRMTLEDNMGPAQEVAKNECIELAFVPYQVRVLCLDVE